MAEKVTTSTYPDDEPCGTTRVHPDIHEAVKHVNKELGPPTDKGGRGSQTVKRALEGTPLPPDGAYEEREKGSVRYRPVKEGE